MEMNEGMEVNHVFLTLARNGRELTSSPECFSQIKQPLIPTG
jgi:hypothetical protein